MVRNEFNVEDKQFKDDTKENMSSNIIDTAMLSEKLPDEVNASTHANLRSLAECYPNEAEIIGQLTERFPEAPPQELLRFIRARQGSLEEASNMYAAYSLWRQGQGTPANLLQAHQAIDCRFIRHTGFAKDGSALIYMQGARYDPSAGPEATALACAHVVDSVLTAEDSQKMTVLLDVRPNEGWPNVSAFSMKPYFSIVAKIFQDNYPERAQRVIVFPMPLVVRGLWAMVSRILDPRTRKKFVILGGSDKQGSPCPVELNNYVELDQLPIDAHHMFQALNSRSP
jgi:hypothetical protein